MSEDDLSDIGDLNIIYLFGTDIKQRTVAYMSGINLVVRNDDVGLYACMTMNVSMTRINY